MDNNNIKWKQTILEKDNSTLRRNHGNGNEGFSPENVPEAHKLKAVKAETLYNTS